MHSNPKLPRFFRIHHKKGQLPTHILAARLGSKTAHSNLPILAMKKRRIKTTRSIYPPCTRDRSRQMSRYGSSYRTNRRWFGKGDSNGSCISPRFERSGLLTSR